MILSSGVELKVTLSPFEDSRRLSQCFLKELKDVKLSGTTELDYNFVKNLICTAFYSKEIETALWVCMQRATYKGQRITLETFEPEEARQDYIEVCREVALKNILPFTKNLSAALSQIVEVVTQESQK